MKKVGDIMAEMGFRKDAPDSVKEAFLKHLIKNTTGVDVETPSEKMEKKKTSSGPAPAKVSAATVAPSVAQPTQLVFEFAQDLGRTTQKVS